LTTLVSSIMSHLVRAARQPGLDTSGGEGADNLIVTRHLLYPFAKTLTIVLVYLLLAFLLARPPLASA